jgi:hypothetical protein
MLVHYSSNNIVHNSSATPTNMKNSAGSLSTNTSNSNIQSSKNYSSSADLSQEKTGSESGVLTDSTGVKGDNFAWNVTRCFPAFQNGFDDHVMLAEMVTFSRLLGVDRFVFYVQHAGTNVLRMLKVRVRWGWDEGRADDGNNDDDDDDVVVVVVVIVVVVVNNNNNEHF